MQYRREIDGLRALAVLPVILFHAGIPAFGGGFVGVDVFFVVSGYLITSIILHEQAAGTFTLAGFYERRARRILPALFVVIIACLPFAWMWMTPSDLEEFFESVVAVALFVSNLWFWRQSGYFATEAELMPLVHTWTLALEEQYYLLFPLFLLAMWRFGRRWVLWSLLMLAFLSFALAEWGSHHKPVSAFFLLPTRGWELLIGACLAFCPLDGRPRPAWLGHGATKLAGSALGVALIAYAIAAFDRSTPYPGVHALAPTLGAALIILFATPDCAIGKLLGSRWLVGIGLVSYSAYLWHQPLFAFARLRLIGEPGTGQLLFLGVLSFVLAYFTWRYVERPMRDRNAVGRGFVIRCGVLTASALVCVGAFGHYHEGFEGRFAIPEELARSLDESALRSECIDRVDTRAPDDWFCRIGEAGRAPSFMVIGDSHALALLPAFEEAASQARTGGVIGAATGCAPLLGTYLAPFDGGCHALNARALEFAKSAGIRRVFLVARWAYYTDGDYGEGDLSYVERGTGSRPAKANFRAAFEQGLENTIAQYAALGVELVVVLQAPQQKFNASYVYYRAYSGSTSDLLERVRALSVSRSEHLKRQAYGRRVFAGKAGRIEVISLDHLFCGPVRCPIGDERVSYYFDEDHLSSVGARMAAPEIVRSILPLSAAGPRQ